MAPHQEAPSIPRRFPVVIEDRILYWMRNSHDSEFRGVLTFDGRVDEKRLERALRLCLDAEPILGCRFVYGFLNQYWERLENLARAELLEVVETGRYDKDMGAFLTSLPPLDLFQGPQVRAWLLRSKNDSLVFKFQHVAGDGGAGHDFLCLLSEIYRKLEKNPDFCPVPNISGSRSLSQVGDNFRFRDKYGIVSRGIKDVKNFMRPMKHFFKNAGKSPRTGRHMIVSLITPEKFRKLKAYGKVREATVNDMLLTLFLRAFYSRVNPDSLARMRVVATADLRRYTKAGRAGAICNLSGFFYLDAGENDQADFDTILARVHKHMTSYKGDYIGMGNFFLTIPLFKMLPFSWALWMHDRMGDMQKKQTRTVGRVAPLYTNAGTVRESDFDFGAPAVTNAYLTTTVPFPPVMTMCLTTFNETVTLTVGFCETTMEPGKARDFLDAFHQDLAGLDASGGD